MTAKMIPGIKERRLSKNLTQKDLAFLCNASMSTVHRWDKSLNGIRINHLMILAHVLDCSVDELLNVERG